jgi:sugar phosphate isomerase/epimerase
VPPNIHFAMGGAIFGDFTLESVKLIAKHGLPGVEPYRGHLMAWLDKPQALKDLLDEYGIRLITASNGGPGQAMEFIDRSKRQETIADHVAFCRDFLKVFGCTHFKINMGSRPQHETTADEIKAIAETVTGQDRPPPAHLGANRAARGSTRPARSDRPGDRFLDSRHGATQPGRR